MLKLGSSKPWPDVMEQGIGERKLDSGAMLEYFQPLLDWLKQQNEGEDLGWSEECPRNDVDSLAVFLDEYEVDAEKYRAQMSFTNWAYESNITDETSAASVSKYGIFHK